jgi:hypothetical protein
MRRLLDADQDEKSFEGDRFETAGAIADHAKRDHRIQIGRRCPGREGTIGPE